jgi:TPR repeat protein
MRGLNLIAVTTFGLFIGSGIAAETLSADELQKKCAENDGPSCAELGRRYDVGNGLNPDLQKARELYEIACALGNPRGCNNLGALIEKTATEPEQREYVVQLYEQACEGGFAVGCGNLGLQYRFGLGRPEDFVRSAELFQQACEAGDQYSCSDYALQLAEGLGVQQDLLKAEEILLAACELEDTYGCHNLGWLLYEVKVPAAPERALEYYGRACELGDLAGCSSQGFVLVDTATSDEFEGVANDLFKRACDGEYGLGCFNLAVSSILGAGMPIDREKAGMLMVDGCINGYDGVKNDDGKGCEAGQANDWEGLQGSDLETRIAGVFAADCDSGSAEKCFRTGVLYDAAIGLPHDPDMALAYYQRACDMNNGPSCAVLGVMTRSIGDLATAADHFKKACELGLNYACLQSRP